MSTETPTCCDCGRERTASDQDYTPMQIFGVGPLGWYSGDDGEMCGECMTKVIRGQS